jgi:hypothetical protein
MIVAIATVAITSVRCLTAPLRLGLSMLRERGEPRGQLAYGLYRDPQGRWLIYADGKVRAVDAGVWRGGRGGFGGEGSQRKLTLQPSCPASGRASTPSLRAGVGDVDGRDKPGHDG